MGVYQGRGSEEYRDPQEFYRRGFLTVGLKDLLVRAVRRMAGDGSDPVIELQTNFGGGRIHSMLALYHLFSGCPVADLTGLEEYVPDLIAFSALVVDTKVIEAIANHERVRMLNYLRIVGLKVGVIMNFMRTKLEWERIVLSNRE